MVKLIFLFLCLFSVCGCAGFGSSNKNVENNIENASQEAKNYYLIKDSVYLSDIVGIRDLGNIKHGEILESTVILKNGFEEPLVISGVEASCGCVNVEFQSEPIMPNKTAKLKLVYNSKNRQGTQFAHIDLITNKGVYVVRVETFIDNN